MSGDDRIILSACLNNLIASERSKPQNLTLQVQEAEKILMKYANLADQEAYFASSREQEDNHYLSNRLEYANLSQVGLFKGSLEVAEDHRIMSFAKDNRAVEFYFRPKVVTVEENIESMLANNRDYTNDELTEVIKGMAEGLHHSTAALGDDSRSLDGYDLYKIKVVEYKGRSFFGIPMPDKQVTHLELEKESESEQSKKIKQKK